jgi:hypothetical protein
MIFFWTKANKLPTIIENTPRNNNNFEKFSLAIIELSSRNLNTITKKAIFGIEDIKLVTGNGEPS